VYLLVHAKHVPQALSGHCCETSHMHLACVSLTLLIWGRHSSLGSSFRWVLLDVGRVGVDLGGEKRKRPGSFADNLLGVTN
jgi:hypothetical protein